MTADDPTWRRYWDRPRTWAHVGLGSLPGGLVAAGLLAVRGATTTAVLAAAAVVVMGWAGIGAVRLILHRRRRPP